MKTKTNSTIKVYSLILIFTALFLTACGGGGTTYTGETRMSTNNLFTVTLEENLYSKHVTAEIELNMNNADIPETYSSIEFYAGEQFAGTFNNGVLNFQPEEFGDVECRAVFLNDDGMAIKNLYDTGQFYIETYYIAYSNSDGGDSIEAIENTEIVTTPSNVSLGSLDMIWKYNLRIPHGKELLFSYVSEKLADITPHFGNNKLEVHFRLDDYIHRSELYPGEPYYAKYIDAETDKWISAPITMTHGVHTLYVCPNFATDRNKISVIHSGEKNGSFTANYESITNWPAK